MIEMVTKYNSQQYQDELEQMFRLRYKIFVEDKGWELPLAKEGIEKDQYDHEETIYLLYLGDNRDVLGSIRLTPTTRPNMLQDIFPHLVEGEIPTGKMVWETSRGFTVPKREHEILNPIMSSLLVGMVEAGLLIGANKMNFVIGNALYPTFLQAGWGVIPLGFPHIDKSGEEIMAGYFTINSLALHNVKRVRKIQYPLLRYNNFSKKVA